MEWQVMKLTIIFSLALIAWGGATLVAQEFTIHGIKGSAGIGDFRVELTSVLLEEHSPESAINLSMRLVDAKGAIETLHLAVPATPRTGEVKSHNGVIALKRVEGLDQYFYTFPEKIVWWFEFHPNSALNMKKHIYMIDGKPVTEQAFQELSKVLTGQDHWYCAEMNDGGETGWESRDAYGYRYKVIYKSGTVDISSISRLPELTP
jgi:hypothetical protein